MITTMQYALRSLTAATMLGTMTLLTGCASTGHATMPAEIGVAQSSGSMERLLDQPGPVTVQTIDAADWQVDLSGLINLDNPTAKSAGLTNRDEPIHLYVHVIRHPTRGLFLVDTGAEHAFVADPDHALVQGLLATFAHIDKLKVHKDTQAIVAEAGQPVQGVFLTHLHLDHVLGMRDVPASAPVYLGLGDAEDRGFMNLLGKGVYDASLAGKGPLRELHFTPDPDNGFDGILDVFGDGTFWALSVPGHTPGSVAYLARTPDGPVLMTGDACHSAWGWEHSVEPGTFSDDQPRSAVSLARLEQLVRRHPSMQVRLGHQALPPKVAPATMAHR